MEYSSSSSARYNPSWEEMKTSIFICNLTSLYTLYTMGYELGRLLKLRKDPSEGSSSYWYRICEQICGVNRIQLRVVHHSNVLWFFFNSIKILLHLQMPLPRSRMNSPKRWAKFIVCCVNYKALSNALLCLLTTETFY